MTHIPIIETLIENYIDQRLAITTQALQEELVESEELRVIAVAEASELPILLYDIPGRTGIPFTTATLLELASLPTIMTSPRPGSARTQRQHARQPRAHHPADHAAPGKTLRVSW